MDQLIVNKSHQLSNASFVSASDACLKIINCLMCYNQSNDPESFVRLAVESLVRKLKEKPHELDELICVITSAGSQSSKCITIPRTLDGRIQFGGKKRFPHLTYSRIWRWPDLNKLELRRISSCNHAFELEGDLVCINPYHYERVVSSVNEMDYAYSPEAEYIDDFTCMNDCAIKYLDVSNNNNSTDLKSSHSSHAMISNAVDAQTNPVVQNWQSSGGPPINQSPHHSNHGMIMNPTIGNSMNQSNVSANSQQGSGHMSNIPNQGQGHGSMNPVSHMQQMMPALTNQRPPEFWCDIAYFELDQQVGELFKVRGQYSRVTVDGYTDPSSPNRFCLGQLSNVHRSEQSEKSRLYIGKGVELDNVGEGDVWIRCLSEFSVFVQSYYLDREAGRAPGDAVHKIYPGAYIKVFDIRQCHEQMRQLAHSAQTAAIRQAAVVVGSVPSAITSCPMASSATTGNLAATAGVGVDDLRRLCMLRLSFVKGWGPDYRRRSIKETPCWIEIQLHRPLQLLDEVLRSMPLNDIKPTRHFFQGYGGSPSRQHQQVPPAPNQQRNISHPHLVPGTSPTPRAPMMQSYSQMTPISGYPHLHPENTSSHYLNSGSQIPNTSAGMMNPHVQ